MSALPRAAAALLVTALFCAGPWVGRAQAQRSADRSGLYAPKVLRYDPVKDEFVYIGSVLTRRNDKAPGGDLAYYGNRLTQFRFNGPPEQGGIYRALELYKIQRKLDPKRYRYRR